MTKCGLLQKQEALAKIEEIFKFFDMEVLGKLDFAHKNDNNIFVIRNELAEYFEGWDNKELTYVDIASVFISSKKLAQDYKLAWLNNRANDAEIDNKDLRVLNPSTGLAELIGDDIEDIKEFLNELEKKDYEKLFELTPYTERLSLLRHMIKGSDNFRDETYLKLEKAIMRQADFSKTIDIITQKGVVFYGMPLQQDISNILGSTSNWLLNHNKFYFLGVPWLFGKGIKKGEDALRELDIPKLAGKIVFTEKVLTTLSNNLTNENKKLLKKSISELSPETRFEIENFLRMGNDSEYDISKLNSKLYTINVSELGKINLPGFMYTGDKAFYTGFSTSFNPTGLVDLSTLKVSPPDYIFNLIKDEIFKSNIGIKTDKAGNFANSFTINLYNPNNNTAMPYSFLLADLSSLFTKATLEKFKEANKATDAGITDVITYNNDKMQLSLEGTLRSSGYEETVGMENILHKTKTCTVTTTNMITACQGKKKSLGIMNQNSIRYKNGSSIRTGLDATINDDGKNSLFISAGISFNLALLKKESGESISNVDEKILTELGITYASPEIKKEIDYISIKTKFTWHGITGDVSLGFQMNTMKADENKMFITYTLKGK